MLRRFGRWAILTVVTANLLLVVTPTLSGGAVAASSHGSSLSPKAAPSVSDPGQRCCMGMAYDGTHIVMFGGCCDSLGRALGDTWTWNGTSWTPCASCTTPGVNEPCPRISTRMAFDGTNVVLFGGTGPNIGGSCPGSLTGYSDTWTWNGSTQSWTQWCPSCTPPPGRYSEGLAYDQNKNRVVMFGGNEAAYTSGPSLLDEEGSAISPVSDTWVWDGSGQTWSGPFNNQTGLCPRSSPGLAYDGDAHSKKCFSSGVTRTVTLGPAATQESTRTLGSGMGA